MKVKKGSIIRYNGIGYFENSFSKIRIIKKQDDKNKETIKVSFIIFTDSLSSLGRIIANSNFNENIPLRIEYKDTNNASSPKSSGVYKRVKIGVAIISNAWLINVPFDKVNAFLVNSEAFNLKILFMFKFNSLVSA